MNERKKRAIDIENRLVTISVPPCIIFLAEIEGFEGKKEGSFEKLSSQITGGSIKRELETRYTGYTRVPLCMYICTYIRTMYKALASTNNRKYIMAKVCSRDDYYYSTMLHR